MSTADPTVWMTTSDGMSIGFRPDLGAEPRLQILDDNGAVLRVLDRASALRLMDQFTTGVTFLEITQSDTFQVVLRDI